MISSNDNKWQTELIAKPIIDSYKNFVMYVVILM